MDYYNSCFIINPIFLKKIWIINSHHKNIYEKIERNLFSPNFFQIEKWKNIKERIDNIEEKT